MAKGESLYVSPNGQHFAWSQSISYLKGLSIRLQDNSNLDTGLTGEFLDLQNPQKAF